MNEKYDIDRLEQLFDAKISLMENRFESLSREISNIEKQNENSQAHLEEKVNLKMDIMRQKIEDMEKISDRTREEKRLSLTQWSVIIAAIALVLNLIVNFFGISYTSVLPATSEKEQQK